MEASEFFEAAGTAMDMAGVAAIAIGALVATVRFARSLLGAAAFEPVFRAYRVGLGRAILLGLEFLVAADIIRTVAISPTLESVAVLGLIVLVRTFLSFTLEVELEGRWPWQQRREPVPVSPDPSAPGVA